jgi:hypothetical protein
MVKSKDVTNREDKKKEFYFLEEFSFGGSMKA